MLRTLFVCLLTAGVFAAFGARKPSWQNDLTPITRADWNYDRASHLMERALFRTILIGKRDVPGRYRSGDAPR